MLCCHDAVDYQLAGLRAEQARSVRTAFTSPSSCWTSKPPLPLWPICPSHPSAGPVSGMDPLTVLLSGQPT